MGLMSPGVWLSTLPPLKPALLAPPSQKAPEASAIIRLHLFSELLLWMKSPFKCLLAEHDRPACEIQTRPHRCDPPQSGAVTSHSQPDEWKAEGPSPVKQQEWRARR